MDLQRVRGLFGRRIALILLFVGLAVIPVAGIAPFLFGGQKFWADYSMALAGMNYAEFGGVHRGLLGSVIWILGLTLQDGSILVYVCSLLMFLLLACWILGRTTASLVHFFCLAIVLADFVLYWNSDPGRADSFIALILVLIAGAAATGRFALGFLALVLGLLAHETAAIYGGPLIAGIVIDKGRYRSIRLQSAFASASVLLIGAAVYFVLAQVPHSSPREILEALNAKIPRTLMTDFAVYFATAGLRGVSVATCLNASDPTYVFHAVTGLALIFVCIFTLSGFKTPMWSSAAIASIPPFLFLTAVSTDLARWLTFSLLSVWLISALGSPNAPESRASVMYARVCCAVALLVMCSPTLVWVPPYRLSITSPLLEKSAHKLGLPYMEDLSVLLNRCDPGWRAFIEDKT